MDQIEPKVRLLLVRHGESLGNVDRSAHAKYPDNALPLTDRGKQQAVDAGVFINAFLNQPYFLEEYQALRKQRHELIEKKKSFYSTPIGRLWAEAHPEFAKIPPELPEKPKVRLWYSPFLRTQQTRDGILVHAKDSITDCQENSFIYEQLFGLMDGLPDDQTLEALPDATRHLKLYAQHGGRHYAPMPMGESRAEVEDRVSNIKDTIHRDIQNSDVYTHIIVSHGYTTRAIAKAWMKYTVAEHTAERNPGNCWVRLLEGYKKDERLDHGWIYRGKESHLEKLLEYSGQKTSVSR